MEDAGVPTAPALPAAPLPKDWTGDRLLELAREIAMNIQELDAILQNNGISATLYESIQASPFFTRALEAYRIEWESATNTNKRLAIKAATALECALPALAARLVDKQEGLDAQVKAGQLFAKISGIDEKKQGEVGADKFSITINLGADEQLRFEKDVTPGADASAARSSEASSAAKIRTLIEGSVNPTPVLSVAEGVGSPTTIQPDAGGGRTPSPVEAHPEGARSSSPASPTQSPENT